MHSANESEVLKLLQNVAGKSKQASVDKDETKKILKSVMEGLIDNRAEKMEAALEEEEEAQETRQKI